MANATVHFGEISAKDLKRYRALAAINAQDALDAFMRDYIVYFSAKYTEYVRGKMSLAVDVLDSQTLNNIGISISSSSVAFKTAQKKVYEEFINKIYGDAAMLEMKITNPAVVEAIKSNTINTFNTLIDGALQKTNNDILTTIRKYQRELIVERNKLVAAKNAGATKAELDAMKEMSERLLFKNNKDFFSMTNDGNFVRYSDGRLVNFDAYNEMATRTTTLNVQRDAVEMEQAMKGERVSAYVLLDNRPLKTGKGREVCKHILANKWHGVALIAHDAEAAETFGIMTIAQAKAQGAMGPNCRHGIRPLSKGLSNMVDNILYFAGMSAGEGAA